MRRRRRKRFRRNKPGTIARVAGGAGGAALGYGVGFGALFAGLGGEAWVAPVLLGATAGGAVVGALWPVVPLVAAGGVLVLYAYDRLLKRPPPPKSFQP